MRKHAFTTLFLAALAAPLSGCPEEKGPMEKAGESIDEAVEEAEDAVEDDGPMEEAGEKVDEAAEKVKDAVK